MSLTGIHIRMARAALGWSIAETAEKSGVSVSTIKRIESAATDVPNVFTSNMEALKQAFESAGVEFLEQTAERGPGVALRLGIPVSTGITGEVQVGDPLASAPGIKGAGRE